MDVNKVEFQSENLEEKIIEAAKDLFVRKGFEQTSMSDIAQAVEINRSTLHYYFRTKEKMFQAVFGSIVISFLPRIQLIFDEEATFMEKLSKVLDEYFSIFMTNPFLPKFILSEIQRDVDQLLNVGRVLHLDQYLRAIGNVIEDEMEKGTIKNIPLPEVLITFMSSVTFPFLSKNLVIALFYEDEGGFEHFLEQWKKRIMHQMEVLLLE
jgi:TetR/AcrR family transcriptional regulator